ncbi:MAG TPA: glutathione S-transferase [Polyangiaceae bacterium]|nr:glutathione S-transferase [Polyangiaceae bacterium]
MKQALRFYRHPISGHCHRVELFLSILALPVDVVSVDLQSGEHKKPPFLGRNPFGQVPVLEDGDLTLCESTAILVYLAKKYDPSGRWLPEDPATNARVMQWLALATGPLSQGPAAARVHHLLGRPADLPRAEALSEQLFAVADAQLARTSFLVGNEPTLADLAHYAYTARAPEGRISLEPYPALRRWLERVEALPGFVPMQQFAPLR